MRSRKASVSNISHQVSQHKPAGTRVECFSDLISLRALQKIAPPKRKAAFRGVLCPFKPLSAHTMSIEWQSIEICMSTMILTCGAKGTFLICFSWRSSNKPKPSSTLETLCAFPTSRPIFCANRRALPPPHPPPPPPPPQKKNFPLCQSQITPIWVPWRWDLGARASTFAL